MVPHGDHVNRLGRTEEPRRRDGHINEFAGYLAVGAAALATGWIGAHYGLRSHPFYLGALFVAAGLLLLILVVRETSQNARLEA